MREWLKRQWLGWMKKSLIWLVVFGGFSGFSYRLAQEQEVIRLQAEHSARNEVKAYRAQIEQICKVGSQMWYDEQKENPGFDPKFSLLCSTGPDGRESVLFILHKLGGYTGTEIEYGGVTKPYKAQKSLDR